MIHQHGTLNKPLNAAEFNKGSDGFLYQCSMLHDVGEIEIVKKTWGVKLSLGIVVA